MHLRWSAARAVLAAMVLAALAVAPPAPAQDEGAAAPIDVSDRAKQIRNDARIPALAGAVIENGRVTAIGVHGARRLGDAPRAELDDQFMLGANTQAFTATLAAILVEEGVIRWDTTVADALPEITDRIVEQYHSVTLEQLLLHRSGLPEFEGGDEAIWQTFGAIEGDMRSARRTAARFSLTLKPDRPAGAGHAFNHLGYVVVGAMLEAAADEDWETMIRQRIFEPLGMTEVGFGPAPVGESIDHPVAHRELPPRVTPVDAGFNANVSPPVYPAVGIRCSLEDWARFVADQLSGAARAEGKLLSADGYRKLFATGRGAAFAMGWQNAPRPWAGGPALHQDDYSLYWQAIAWIAPRRDMAVLAFANSGGAKVARRACEAMINSLIFDPPEPGGD